MHMRTRVSYTVYRRVGTGAIGTNQAKTTIERIRSYRSVHCTIVMFKKAKSRPSLRARDSEDLTPTSSPLARSSFAADDPDTSLDVEEKDGDVSLGSVFERKKAGKRDKDKRQGRPIGGSRLSFGGDKAGGEGEPSKPRRSLLSQSTTARLENAAASSSSSPLGASPSYSSDYLSQLKASTPTRGPRPPRVDDDDGIEEVDANGLSKLARDKYASVDTTEGIPDTAAIAAAKMKRQARVEISKHDAGNEEDYISLGGGKLIVHDGDDRGPHPESRLMREEDEGDEGDEGEYFYLSCRHPLMIDMAMYTEANDKLHIGKKAKGDAARRLRNEIGELIDDRYGQILLGRGLLLIGSEMEDEDDEETQEWEMAQVRRAGGFKEEEPERPPKASYQPTPSKLHAMSYHLPS